MPRFLAALCLTLAGLAPPAAAAPAEPAHMLDQAFDRLGLGLRVDFGGYEQAARASLAFTTTGELYDRQFTVPLVALDFTGRHAGLGTLLGIRLHADALRHDPRVLLLPAATPTSQR